MIPFAEYAPDRADIDTSASDIIKNVVPQAKSYGPMPTFSAYSGAMAERSRGGILARKEDGSYVVYAATSDNLWWLNGTTWAEISKTTDVYNLAAADNWQFLQFGTKIIATHVGDVAQVVDIEAGGDFADLGGSPPQAKYIFRAAGFVVLAGINGEPRRVQWSAHENTAGWTAGTDLSDFQDLPSPGIIVGGTGDERGAFVFTTTGAYRMEFLPGSRATFSFTELNPSPGRGDEPAGAIAHNSIVRSGNRVFYLSESGFMELSNPPQFIGRHRVDKFFLDDVDLDFLEDVQGAADPVTNRIFWRYRSEAAGGSDRRTDKILVYDVVLDRWSIIERELEGLLNAATPGYTLEQLDTTLGYTNIDTMETSLDSRLFKGGRPALAGFNTDAKLGFFSGVNMEGTLETGDVFVAGEGRRAFVNGFRPLADADGLYGQVGSKLTHGGSRTWTAEAAQESTTGLIPGRADGRLHRFRVRIPSGTEWEHAIGVERPEARATGRK